jgi:hypothetical protein
MQNRNSTTAPALFAISKFTVYSLSDAKAKKKSFGLGPKPAPIHKLSCFHLPF